VGAAGESRGDPWPTGELALRKRFATAGATTGVDISRIDWSVVGVALLFAVPAGVATGSLLDALVDVDPGYAIAGAGAATVLIFWFVLLLVVTGSPAESGSETP
jgi:hypothetical protein